MNHEVFAEVTSFLNAAGRNYTVFLRACSTAVISHPAIQQIGAALGTRVDVSDSIP